MKNIDVETLKSWMKSGEATLVDVRRVDEYAREHIPGAMNLPLDILSEEALSPINSDKVVMQCNTGGRSARGCAAVEKLQPDYELFSLEGGIAAWKEVGNDTVKTKRTVALPLHRQVQIGAGSLVVIGVVLGYLLNPAFYILSLFVGLGLLGAGTTGWCGMAAVFARAPWNKVKSKR